MNQPKLVSMGFLFSIGLVCSYGAEGEMKLLVPDDYGPRVLSATEETWEDVYVRKMSLSTWTTVYDKFGPFSRLDWVRKLDLERSEYIDEYNNVGRKTFEKIFTYSLRETADAFLDFDGTEDRLKEFADDLFSGSVGNTAEEEIESVSTTYSSTEEKWFKYRNGKTYKTGIRIRTKPYVYFKKNLFNVDNVALAYFETRLGYNGSDFVEQIIAIPLLYNWDMRIGASIKPTKLGSDDSNRWQASWSISHPLGIHSWDGAIAAGVGFGPDGHSVSIALAKSF